MSDQLQQSLGKIDQEIQRFAQLLCRDMNLPFTALVPNWVLAVDERLFDKTGAFAGDSVWTVSKPEQPKFISEKLLEKGYEQYVQRQYLPRHSDGPDDDDEDVEVGE